MRKFNVEIDEQHFNLLWRSLDAYEQSLLRIIENHQGDDDSEEAAFAGNDLVYLRLYRDDLEREARAAKFSDGVFCLSDDIIEL